jgi:zinc protease
MLGFDVRGCDPVLPETPKNGNMLAPEGGMIPRIPDEADFWERRYPMTRSAEQGPPFQPGFPGRRAALFAPALVFALMMSGRPAISADAPLKQPGRWAQDYVDRKPDPAVRFGVLPNGLRYAILHNETPRDSVVMRMRIGSGSLEEHDGEEGLAHFLEHMAFRGSVNVADGDMVKMLERQGLRFGPDINASTAQDQTVYKFNFPRADPSALEAGFTLFREIGERLTLSQAAIEAEKGVVLSEERVRDVPSYQALKVDLGNALAGTRAISRWPIGRKEVIEGATTDRLARYYKANYRPDNATIIVVGNIDVDGVEREIATRFSDWKREGNAEAFDPGAPEPLQPAAEFVSPGARDRMTLTWIDAADRRAETEALEREQVLESVAVTILNNRLADRAARPGSPFLTSTVARTPSMLNSSALTQIAFTASQENWREALSAVVEEQRQLLTNGVSISDLQRASAMTLTQERTRAAQAPTRTNAALAEALVSAVDEDALYTSPAQSLAFVEPVLADLKREEVDAALHDLFSGKGPVLFRSARKDPLTPALLEKAMAEDFARPLSPRAAEQAIEWPYLDFGAPSSILSMETDAPLGATLVQFANGTRLLVKPTKFEKDRIHVKASMGNGRVGVEAASARALWATPNLTEGGTGKLSFGEITRWAQTSGKSIGLRLVPENRAFALTGVTSRADFDSELRLLAAYARDPGFRPEMGEKLAATAPMVAGQLESTAGAVFRREADLVLAGGDSRFADFPKAEDIVATQASDLPALLHPALSGPADVTIVGDVSVEEAVKAVQATFGAGVASARAPDPDVHIVLPEGRAEPWAVSHLGRPDQGVIGQYWALSDYYADPKLAHVASVAAAILSARLVDTVREKLGLTYSPQTRAVASTTLPGQGYIGATIETSPANFEAFRSLLARQIADLADTSVVQDELERAQKPLSEARLKQLETNAFWLGSLASMLRDPRARQVVLEFADALDSVTPEDIRGFFQRHLIGRPPIEIIAKAM